MVIYRDEASAQGRYAEPMHAMLRRSSTAFAAALRAAILGAALLHAAPSHAQQGSFAGLSGAWSGGGFLKSASGQRERLRCASDSYRFDVNANIVSEGGTLSGSWTETSRNASGSVSGRVSGGQIQAKIDGAGFSASLVVSTRGARQSVTIEAPGHEVTEVSVALTRAR
jgi:hypothetical protein